LTEEEQEPLEQSEDVDGTEMEQFQEWYYLRWLQDYARWSLERAALYLTPLADDDPLTEFVLRKLALEERTPEAAFASMHRSNGLEEILGTDLAPPTMTAWPHMVECLIRAIDAGELENVSEDREPKVTERQFVPWAIQNGFQVHTVLRQKCEAEVEASEPMEAGPQAAPAEPRKNTITPAHTCTAYGLPRPRAWREIRVRFIDGETVSVNINGKSKHVLFNEMGFAKNSKKPDVQWKVLCLLAQAPNGILEKRHLPLDNGGFKKRIHRLSEGLRAFFCLAGDPVRALEDNSGWQAVFLVDPGSRM